MDARSLLQVLRQIHRDQDDLVLTTIDAAHQAFVIRVRPEVVPVGGRVVLVTLDATAAQPATLGRLYRSLQWLPSWVLDLPVFIEGPAGEIPVASFSESDRKPPAAEYGSRILCADVTTEGYTAGPTA